MRCSASAKPGCSAPPTATPPAWTSPPAAAAPTPSSASPCPPAWRRIHCSGNLQVVNANSTGNIARAQIALRNVADTADVMTSNLVAAICAGSAPAGAGLKRRVRARHTHGGPAKFSGCGSTRMLPRGPFLLPRGDPDRGAGARMRPASVLAQLARRARRHSRGGFRDGRARRRQHAHPPGLGRCLARALQRRHPQHPDRPRHGA